MLRVLQINLQHKKAATAALCKYLAQNNIDIVLIQEPWVNRGRVSGLGEVKGKLIYDLTAGNVRTCIIVRNRLHALKMLNFCSRDQAAIRLKTHMAGHWTEIVIASVYLPYDYPSPPPSTEMERLVEHCRASNLQILMGIDANSHHTVWGSSDINKRGEYLLDYIITNNLDIMNRGYEPTFITRTRSERIDITLASSKISSQITHWHVSREPSLSDHRYIRMEISEVENSPGMYRDPRRTNWEKFKRDLITNLNNVKRNIKTSTDVELASGQLQDAIINSYQENCTEVRQNTSKNTSWWNKDLAKLRKETRFLFNKAKRTGEWEKYTTILTKYNIEIRKAKRNSWRKFCEEVETTSEAARIHRILAKDPINPIGNLLRPDGNFTESGRETLEVLLQTHLPDSKVTEEKQAIPNTTNPTHRATKRDWKLANRVITQSKISWAIDLFEPYKSPGPDGIFPVFLQQGMTMLVPVICKLLRASLATGYIPANWKKARVVFIPKPGKDYSQAKSFRPITLSSFMIKLMEKLVEIHVRENFLKERPLHKNQHAYQTGKSCETALHQLVSKIEAAHRNKEIALGAFLDIEGAFDHTSFRTMDAAVAKRGVDDTTRRWIQTMLCNRTAEATLLGENMEVSISKGCPQGGVLSPLLWDLVIDELLVQLSNAGYYTQGYADDVLILVVGNFKNIVSDLLQQALNIVERWCLKENLKVNPNKTALIAFTKKKKMDSLRLPKLFNTQLQLTQEVKYLGITLDAKLTWNKHLEKTINKGKMALMAARRAVGTKWGLKPRMVHWLYTAVVRPMLTYGSLVWWPKVTQRKAILELTKLQRLACICITGAMRSTPTAAMETILNLPPLDIYIRAEARMGAFRLECNGYWEPYEQGHSRITKCITSSLMEMRSDEMTPKNNFTKPFSVQLRWEGEVTNNYREGKLVWYTDGSKTASGTGAGIYGDTPRCNTNAPLGSYASVFQAEVHAIELCLRENIDRGYRGKTILINSDSQAALQALACSKIRSKLVWNCLQTLLVLANQNKVTLRWVPGHKGIKGNEEADALARKASATKFTGPEPAFGIPKSSVRLSLTRWMLKEHQSRWDLVLGQQNSKRMVKAPSKALTDDILNLSRNQIRHVTGLITGHCHLREHLHKMGIFQDEPTCRLCNEEDETASHIILECQALTHWRYNLLGPVNPQEDFPKENLVKRLLSLMKVTNLFN